jgi:hypothetical protein
VLFAALRVFAIQDFQWYNPPRTEVPCNHLLT